MSDASERARHVNVVPLERERLAEAAALLGRAFHDDPLWVWLVGDERLRRRALPWLFERALEDLGEAELVRTAGALEGVATWLPPGVEPSPPSLATLVGSIVRLRRALPRLVRYGRGSAAMLRAASEVPAWTLGGIAVEPSRQGQGIGSALVSTGLERVGEAPVVLLTSNPANLRFYERHGFEVVSEQPLPEGGPPAWALARSPAK